MVNWSELPDLTAVALLACAFASVARRSPTPVSGIWLTGWVMIALHFAAFLFLPTPGILGSLATFIGIAALIWAGHLFIWSTIPHRGMISSRWMLGVFAGTNTLYIALLVGSPPQAWVLSTAAALIGALPLLITLVVFRKFNSPLRWVSVSLYSCLSIFLLIVQGRPGNGTDMALNALLFTVYFSCCIHFWHMYRRATTGAFITICGFFAWSAVFVVAPLILAFMPSVHIEDEVWNLPKFVVAFGMILLLLEDQIEHNLHLALHDHLTGLANRRLFQDRLASALERARRTETQTALLVVDLDHFKSVNDTLGHHMGDKLLVRIGEIISGRVRRSDTVARTGGDEFSVILEEPTSPADAVHVGRSLIELLREPIELGEHTVQVGASIGIAVFPEDAVDMESLCIAADLRMYDSKHDAARAERAAIGASRSLPTLKPQTESGLRGVD